MGFFIMKHAIPFGFALAIACFTSTALFAVADANADQKRTFAQVKHGCDLSAQFAKAAAERRMEGAPLVVMMQRFEDGYDKNLYSYNEKLGFQATIAEVYDRRMSPSEEYEFFYNRCIRLNIGSF